MEDNLTGISFTLERGQTLGIIGPTGSGKSTLIQLLLRFYDPDAGAIRIDGRDLRTIPPQLLHSIFGVVFQNDFLYAMRSARISTLGESSARTRCALPQGRRRRTLSRGARTALRHSWRRAVPT